MLDLAWNIQVELIIRLLVAGVCGCLIGYERKNRNKEAGIRTHIIVAIASCLMMEISKFGFGDVGDFDGARLAAQVVSGIGFLGAGMIFVHKNSVKGLTTAAGVWATSGIGMAIGAGMYVIGIVTTVIIFLFQIILHKNFKILLHHNSDNLIFIVSDEKGTMDMVKELIENAELSYSLVSMRKLPDNRLKMEFAVSFMENFNMFEFIKNAAENEGVEAVYSE